MCPYFFICVNNFDQQAVLIRAPAMDVKAMDENQARQRLLEGGYFVALGVPPGVEFGIDLKSYTVRDFSRVQDRMMREWACVVC